MNRTTRQRSLNPPDPDRTVAAASPRVVRLEVGPNRSQLSRLISQASIAELLDSLEADQLVLRFVNR